MRTIEEKLASLGENDIWLFTKQTAIFDEAFKMVQLFSSINDIENTNIEQYFEDHHEEYNIATHRHRALVISQMFGLLTKSKFFAKGSQYNSEKPTAVFEKLNEYEIGSPEYNTIKSEQLLKVRMKSIIDSTQRVYNQSILPLIYSFSVLWKLKEQGVNSISKGQFYTYIMTSKSYADLDETVELLSHNPPISELYSRFRDKSRIEILLNSNCNLFSFDRERVSINERFGEYFYRTFFITTNIDRLNLLLNRPADYAYFLYNHQDFGVNIIDEPDPTTAIIPHTPRIIADLNNSSEIEGEDGYYDAGYVNLVDGFKEDNITIQIADGASEREPQYGQVAGRRSVIKNPVLGKIAIMNVGYQCVFNSAHDTFESKLTGKKFMEAHHLIPIRYAHQIWEQFGANIDCVENLVSLCPNCHRAVHYGSLHVRREIITRLFNEKQNELASVGINISLEELLDMY